MNQTYTKDYDEWNARRERSVRNDDNQRLRLDIPENLRSQFKGFAFGPMVLDDDDVAHACKAKVLDHGDSIYNYDYSDCYLLDYHIVVHDTHSFDDEHNIDFNAPRTCTTDIRLRYAGQELSLHTVDTTDDVAAQS